MKIVRNNDRKITQIDNYKIKDYIVFERKLGGYSDCMFQIEDYWEDNKGNVMVILEGIGSTPLKNFFTGCRPATRKEIRDYNKYGY